ncbi:hypothetical protein BKA62DRAFT_834936 [Auriculariales sp. MPI-PUGE-AT-0066]|nr:hypothetical protein BKA62DRAFT_834936 [Auriculariales sp. MPI-PUGE-AT-0066]
MLVHLLAVLLTVLSIALAQSPLWGQCGGQGWTGATTCVAGATCTYSNSMPPWLCFVEHYGHKHHDYNNKRQLNLDFFGARFYQHYRAYASAFALGDSITYGVQSSDGTGYRTTLHKLLEPGNTVDFIGSVKAGTMTDNDNEGHSGWTIDQSPVVLALHAGTNDIYGGNFGTLSIG